MKITIEHEELIEAVRDYVRHRLQLDLPEDESIIFDTHGSRRGPVHLSVTVSNARPLSPALPIVRRPATREVAAVDPLPPIGPKPLDEALDEVRDEIDWTSTALGSTDLAALGKADGADFADEVPAKRGR